MKRIIRAQRPGHHSLNEMQLVLEMILLKKC